MIDAAELAAAVIAAINSRNSAELASLLDPNVEVATGRSVHAGPEPVLAWAAKEYDNLVRRYAADDLRVRGRRVLVLGSVQYVWKEGERSPTAPRSRSSSSSATPVYGV